QDGLILTCNHTFAQLLRYKNPEDLQEKPFLSLAPQQQPNGKPSAELWHEYQTPSATTSFRAMPWQLQTADGEYLDCLLKLQHLTFNGTTQLFVHIVPQHRISTKVHAASLAYQAINALDAHIAILDESGRIVLVNDAWRRFAAANGADVSRVCEGADYLSVCDTAAGISIKEAAKIGNAIRLITNGKMDGFAMEYDCHSPEQERWFVLRITRFEQDKPYLVTTHETITERVQAERALRQREELMRMILQNMPVMLVAVSNRKIIAWNKECERVTGYNREEMEQHPNPFTLLFPDAAYREHLLKAHKEQVYRNWEVEITCKNGEKREILISNISANFPIPEWDTWIVGIDITPLREAEKSQVFHTFLLQNILDAVISADMDFVVTSWNPAAELMYGWTAKEAIGRPFVELTQPQYPGSTREAVIEKFLEQGKWRGEAIHHHRNGAPINILASVSMLRDGNGKPTGIVTVNRDITEHKMLEAEALRNAMLETELEKEREVAELKGRFMSIVSHQFRTPLAVIQMAVDKMIQYNERLTYQQRLNSFERISAQIRYMTQLIEDVLKLGQAQKGAIEAQPEQFNVCRLCEDVVEEVHTVHPQGHFISLACDYTGQMYQDRKLLWQVLDNLLGNAVKYTPQDGMVALEVYEEGDTVVFIVKDSGIGIPEEDQKHLFEPFHRATNVGSIKGTGMGMAIVKEYITTMGGTIEVESEVNVGTTFTVRLPKQLPRRG
ncbi:MAG: PAS domain-containing sensor histidine kinase, partial [Chloroflexi bacterium]